MQQIYVQSLVSGGLIGLSAALLLEPNGRIAGVSGIIAIAVERVSSERLSRILFLGGLLCGPLVYRAFLGAWPQLRIATPIIPMLVAGPLAGIGTRLGSRCTQRPRRMRPGTVVPALLDGSRNISLHRSARGLLVACTRAMLVGVISYDRLFITYQRRQVAK